jgi:hypothetical protein
MKKENAVSQDYASAQKIASQNAGDNVSAGGVFSIECKNADGTLKWKAKSHNLVVNVGLQDMVSKYFTGSSYTAAWYIGLYGSGATNTPAAGDTMSSHAGWTEVTDYSQATRPVCTFGSATAADPSVIGNSASPAVYSINSATTVGGAFLTSSNTPGPLSPRARTFSSFICVIISVRSAGITTGRRCFTARTGRRRG